MPTLRTLVVVSSLGAIACGPALATDSSGSGDDPDDGLPPGETCGNGLDDDGNGVVDDSCPCEEGATQACHDGPAEEAGVGACHWGMQRCVGDDEFWSWGPCEGQGGPSVELCDGIDNDCSGAVDDGASCGGPPPDDTPPPDGPPPNTTCTAAIDVTPSGPGVTREVSGTTCGAVDVARLECNPRAAPEVFYVWTSPNTSYSVSWAITPGFSVGLAQQEESCGPGPFYCEYTDEWFDAHTHTLVVERTDADCGPFTLRVTRTY